MDRCDECGFVYDVEDAPAAAGAIVNGVDVISSWLLDPEHDLRTRRAPDTWSPLEYGCHVRDVLLVQRERVLAARRMDCPTFDPMGRDERVDHDGYDAQKPAAVARQMSDASTMFANVLKRLGPADWDRTLTYKYPQEVVRTLRWVAVHTVHEIRHHAQDIERQLNT